MTDKPLSANQMPSANPDGQASESDELSRIVDYLNTKRSSSHQRAHGLVKELVQRREDSSPRRQAVREPQEAQRFEPSAPSSALQERDVVTSNVTRRPLLAERYHAFCHDLDLMLDNFKSRVKDNKPVQH
jgi:hypothetical protein